MPKMDGIEATKRLKQYDETIKVLILSSFSEQDYVIPALEAGADGYQLKEVQPEQLVASIIAVSRKCEFSPESNTCINGAFCSKEGSRKSFFNVNEKSKRYFAKLRKEEATRRLQQNFILQNKL